MIYFRIYDSFTKPFAKTGNSSRKSTFPLTRNRRNGTHKERYFISILEGRDSLGMAKKYETAIRTGGRRRSRLLRQKKERRNRSRRFGNRSGFCRRFSDWEQRADSSADRNRWCRVLRFRCFAAEPPVSSQPSAITLPEGLTTVAPPEESSPSLQVGSIDSVTAPTISSLTG